MTNNSNKIELALPAIRALQQRAADLEAQRFEPIAIVSMACRLPGGVDSPEAYWRLLSEGRDAVEAFPPRWDGLDIYDPDPEAVGKSYAREGGFVRDVERFDASFFGVSPREALSMDPQQRVALEVAWEALERAGLDASTLSGTRTGVYLGMMGSDYAVDQRWNLEAVDGYHGTGNLSSVASGRLAYVLGLQGPALTVDTACSSSLVTLHLACAALRQRECDVALAGGVTIMSTPVLFVEFSRLKGMSKDGRCRSFSAEATGAGWSEGCGMLVLKRLSSAERDGDRVLAVIRGSAVNQDGRSQGLTAPNGPAQQRVIRDALAAGRLAPADIDAIEAHGTGTSLGDPIEAGALADVFGPGRDPSRPVLLGSSKSNIGHAQAAAGVAGVIKMVLALEHGALPQSLYASSPTPHVDWERSGLSLLVSSRPWERGERKRRAGVSSFGISGTNAHVIVEEAPVATRKNAPVVDVPRPIVISGRDERALRAQAARWCAWLEEHGNASLYDVAYTAAERRAHFGARASIAAGSVAEAALGLRALSEGKSHASLTTAAAGKPRKVAFVFPGQGSHWREMARDLLEQSPEFVECATACDAALRPMTGWSVLALLRGESVTGPDGRALSFDRIDVVQPMLFTMYVSLAATWRSLGLIPGAVVGHSQGEIAAAVVAGALSLSDGARIVATRSHALATGGRGGDMAIIERPVEEVEAFIAPFAGALSIAAVNMPGSAVISGDAEALDELLEDLDARGVFCGRLNADCASHSVHMDPLLPGLREAFTVLRPKTAEVAFYSTVTGGLLAGEALDGSYWCRNLREPVRFDRTLARLVEDGYGIFVEVSPHPVLAMPLDAGTSAGGGVVVGTLERERGGLAPFMRTLGVLHAHGQDGVLGAAFANRGALIDLPTYAFQGERFWIEPRKAAGDARAMGLFADEHPWLSASLSLADGTGARVFSGRVSLSDDKWLADHSVFGRVLVPGAALVEMALHAGRAVGTARLHELTLLEPLVLSEDSPRRVQVEVERADDAGRRAVSIFSQAESSSDEGDWTRHAVGELSESDEQTRAAVDLRTWPVPGAEPISLEAFYAGCEERGIHYGPQFQGLVEAARKGDTWYGRVRLPDRMANRAAPFEIHPALFDAALHLGLLAGAGEGTAQGALLPFGWTDVDVLATGHTELLVQMEIERTGEEAMRATIHLADERGQVVARIGGLEARRAAEEQAKTWGASRSEHLYRVAHVPCALEAVRTVAKVTHLSAASAAGIDDFFAKLDDAEAIPECLVVHCAGSNISTDGTKACAVAASSLELLQRCLADTRLELVEIVWLTRGAVSTAANEAVTDLDHAVLPGLLRSARAEHPFRSLRHVDLGPDEDDTELLARILADSREPEVCIRRGQALAPRLVRAVAEPVASAERTWDPESAVLVTGGTGELGELVAHHLVRAHGVRRLVLTSRRGMDAPGAAALVESLREAGAESVDVVACDVAKRDEVDSVLARGGRSWGAIVHLAGVLDDGLLVAQTAERFARVMAPKALGALHLDAASADSNLRAFVVFSSVAGVLGSAGQSNYAAASSFLDGLAAARRARGRHATSIAWGLWKPRGKGMTSHLGSADLARMKRLGILPMSGDEALALLDAALDCQQALLVPVKLDLPTLRRTDPGPMFRALVPQKLRRASAAGARDSLRERLLAMSEDEKKTFMLDLVRREAAVVLGVAGPDAVPAQHVLKSLGLDSLMAVELRRRLSTHVGTALPATLVFDYPTPVAIASLLVERASGAELPRRREPERTTRPMDEPIAIVSMACRIPGGADTPEAYWELLLEGRDVIEPLPSRWAGLDIYDPDPDANAKTYAREGGFLRDVDQFDAAFFGISPREAVAMDPQQRLVLEVAWEALERAGLNPDTLLGSQTGVYLGCMGSDYASSQRTDLALLDGYQGTGSASSVLSGRVAYVLGLQGPAMTVDTACSSSLVALHLACTALRNGECDLALAGGVTVMSTPALFVEFSRLKAMSRDGRCKSFSADADGAGWSEACGILLLKPLSAARRDGDRVLAVIRGSAVNQDGKSQGLTAPNGPSQEQVIRSALSTSGLGPADIDAIEAHGTGTALGDPIEAGALAAVFGPERDPSHPLLLGSSKSNIGHSQAAAGVVGVMKMVLALQNGVLPKTLHADRPSPHIAWEGSGLSLVQEPRAWQRSARPRRAGISSLGISGTNAHLVVEEAPLDESHRVEALATETTVPIAPILVTGRDENALRAQAARWASWLRAHPDASVHDLSATSVTRRALFDARAVVVAATCEEAAEGLSAIAEDRAHGNVLRETARASRVAFLFSGQGSQAAQMGRDLHARSPAFRAAFDRACAALDAHLDRPIRDVVFAEEGSEAAALLDSTAYTQPALFAFEVALYEQWRAWGIEPSAVAGHSVGELAAAHVAGVFDLEDAAKLVAARGRLMQACKPGGAMASIEATEEEIAAAIAGAAPCVTIAAVNGPRQTVISGDEVAVSDVVARFRADGRRTARLRVSHAFHSAHMDTMLAAFSEIATSCTYHTPKIRLVSSITTSFDVGSPEYWVQQARDAVRFLDVVRTLEGQGVTHYVECGPGAVLSGMTAESLTGIGADAAAPCIPSLRAGTDELASLVRAARQLLVSGLPVRFTSELVPSRVVPLPTYAFQRQRFWLEPPARARDAGAGALVSGPHPWLLAETPLAESGGHLFSGRLSSREHAWLADHVVFGTVIVPATGFLEVALAAAQATLCAGVRELTLLEPLVLDADVAVRLQVHVGGDDGHGQRSIAIYSQPELAGAAGPWTRHAVGELGSTATSGDAQAKEHASQATRTDVADAYARLRARGLEYGPSFQGIVDLAREGSIYKARISLPKGAREGAAEFVLHPALVDAALQVAAIALCETKGPADSSLFLPFAWSNVRAFAARATDVDVRVDVRADGGSPRARLSLFDASGASVAEIGSLELRSTRAEQIRAARSVVQHLYQVDFLPIESPERATSTKTMVVGARDGVARLLGCDRADDVEALLAMCDSGATAPDDIVLDWTSPPSSAEPSGLPGAARQTACDALRVLQRILAEPRLEGTRVVFVTRGAVRAKDGDDVTALAAAPVWGLIRSARSERQDRVLRLLDLDPNAALDGELAGALAASNEPELALRSGTLLAARFSRALASEPKRAPSAAAEREMATGPCALVTGGTGELGRAVAAHVVRAHGVRHLVLASRRELAADAAEELTRSLRAAGAETVRIVACNVAERADVERLVREAPRPLGMVFHLAGVLDDGLVEGQTEERVDAVLRPKVDGAWHLHELTKEMPLSAFVLFSSAAGTLGGPGQASYAAGNAFLDALSTHRRAHGLVAKSLAWGAWGDARGMGMAARLGKADVARMARAGVRPLGVEQALALLDSALELDREHLVPIALDLQELGRGEVAPIYRHLVRPRLRLPAASATSASSLRERLRHAGDDERRKAIAELVRTEVAAVLALSGGEANAVQTQQVLSQLGLDSLMAVDLRKRLAAAVGVALPATLAFDYPTPAAIAELILKLAFADTDATTATAITKPRAQVSRARLEALVERLRHAAPEELESDDIASTLLSLESGLGAAKPIAPSAPSAPATDITAEPTPDLLDFLDRKLASLDAGSAL